MTKFICSNCKYKLEAEEMPKTCAYCNEETLEKEKSASEILNEVSNILE